MEEQSYDELRKKTVAQLREIAKDLDHPAVQGYSQLHKDQLLHSICTALGLEEHIHHEVVGVDKSKIKAQIRKLKTEREAALQARDSKQLKTVRRQIRGLKRQLRKATV